MKLKDEERKGDRECRDALKALEESKKVRLQEEGECSTMRRKCALAKELKAKMEDQEARLALREKQQETPVLG